jgi:hypothetical protein
MTTEKNELLDRLDRLERDASDGPWAWRKFGDRNHLVCDYGPRHIVLSNARSRNSAGILEDVHDRMPDMALIPELRNHARALIEVARAGQMLVELCKDYNQEVGGYWELLNALEKLK